MLSYILRRILSLALILLALSLFIFLLVKAAPGDPIRIMLGETATQQQVADLTRLYGLDQPWPSQYLLWLRRAVQGDLGLSIRRQLPVTQLILERMGATLELAVFSLLISIVIGIPLGVIAAVWRNTLIDAGTMMIALIWIAAPNFWIGLLLLSTLGLSVDWLPIFGRGPSLMDGLGTLFQGNIQALFDSLRHILLPAVALGTSMVAVLTRITRSSLLEILGQDFIRTAQAKGVRSATIIIKHALRNGLFPVITVIGVQFGYLLGGAIIIENVFAWPGVGRLVVDAINQRDLPIVQGVTLLMGAVFVLTNLIVDLSYSFLDPRVRYA